MKITQESVWRQLPPVELAVPVLALAVGTDSLWAAGMGGLARLQDEDTWRVEEAGLPLTSITALAQAGNILIAGGIGGIARSADYGRTWQSAALEAGFASITAFAVSPDFSRDRTMLAATLHHGILRTDDGGQKWHSANFGLQDFEVSALLWYEGKAVFAATTDGLYRSSNGGRAWRLIGESEGMVVVALAQLPGGTLVAALEEGALLCSYDSGANWEPYGNVLEGIRCSSLWATSRGSLLLSTVERGLLRSTDQGEHWEPVLTGLALSFAYKGELLYAGTTSGVSMSADDGLTWRALPVPPVDDLRRLHVCDNRLLLAGSQTGLVLYRDNCWQAVESLPSPLTSVFVDNHGLSLFVAGPHGLQRSTNGGESWQTVIEGEEGNLGHFAFRPDGRGWAGSANGARLWRTDDGGASWEPLKAPFGVLTLAALLATPQLVVATTCDLRLLSGQIWISDDDGENWQQAAEVQPLLASIIAHSDPPLIILGNLILFVENRLEQWREVSIAEREIGQIRRVTGTRHFLLALTTTGLYRSDDGGATWTAWKLAEESLPIGAVRDIAVAGNTLYLLLAGGRVRSYRL